MHRFSPLGRASDENHCEKLRLCTFSTNLANTWSGNIFGRCLDRLLLVYLRVYLAPEREGAHMELVSKLSKDAKERKAKQVKKQSGTRQIYAVKLVI
jgi:hypothetical protein